MLDITFRLNSNVFHVEISSVVIGVVVVLLCIYVLYRIDKGL